MLQFNACRHCLRISLRFGLRRRFSKTTEMAQYRPTTSVRLIPGEERLQITLKYNPSQNDEPRSERVFNFDRLQDEELHKSLTRMAGNISKVADKRLKNKKKKPNPEPDSVTPNNNPNSADSSKTDESSLILSLYNQGSKVTDDTPNSKAWSEGATLVIGSEEFQVCMNMPTVKSVVLSDCIMSGFPQYPKIDAEFVDLDKCQMKWFRSSALMTKTTEGDTQERESQSKKDRGQEKFDTNSVAWEEVHTGFNYVPTNDDIGKRMKVSCLPVDGRCREGSIKEAVSKNEVNAGPGFCPFENRHRFTQSRAKHGNFRMVTYNMLADLYADSDFSRDYLYPYCPPYALDIDYRKQLLLKEITGYNADLVCLQEMDYKLFVHDLLPAMQQQGFEGLAKMKVRGETLPEGSSIFFRKDKFRLVSQHDMNMAEALESEEKFEDIFEKINCNSSKKKKVPTATLR